MQTNITVIVIDNEYYNRDYDSITSYKVYSYQEDKFNFKFIKDANNIVEYLANEKGFDVLITIGNVDGIDNISKLPFDIRKRWLHFNEYNRELIGASILATFLFNIRRCNDEKMFSIFTCSYKTSKNDVYRLYGSLLKQTYQNWNWWILDDTPDDAKTYIYDIKDPRVHIIKNCTQHGNIGLNKHMIAMICDGDYLVEVDHDDELTNDCLEYLHKAFEKYPDADFAYSYCFEEVDGRPIVYDEGFANGLGKNGMAPIEDKEMFLSLTPDINCLGIRHITSMPNHVRCWKKEFYHKIGGHCCDLSVMDDAELLIQTFLHGKMCKIPRVLYIQHEGTTNNGESARGSSTQAKRFKEIVRTGLLLKQKYDKIIHDKTISDGYEDPYWDDEHGYSDIWHGVKENVTDVNYILDC